VVNVTVDQSTNLVVDPDSLSIPANGAESFKVKLAKAPTAPVTVTVTTSTPDLTTTPASLIFTSADFNINQTVSVIPRPGAVPGAQSVLLDAGSLGQFKLPVTITPASNTIFFIDAQSGDDDNPGTAARPWKTVEKALNASQPSGSKVVAAAIAGNDVVVTILREPSPPSSSEDVSGNINTPALVAGSVTVLKSPSAGTFTLNMGANKLTLNRGYKLQDINITCNLPSTGGTAVTITHPTAGLASVEVRCKAGADNDICVMVKGGGSHILRDVKVGVEANSKTNTIGIKNDANTTLSIIGGEVRINDNTAAITLINAQGVLTATGLTVDMTGSNHARNSTGILLNARGSFVTGSTIKVNDVSSGSGTAIGIKVLNGASKSTVEGNIFEGAGTNSRALTGNSNLSSDALRKNAFSGTFASGGPVQDLP